MRNSPEPASPPPPDPRAGVQHMPPSYAAASALPRPLEWTPPALGRLNAQAVVKESFTLDRNMLGLAAGLIPDSQAEDRK